MPNKSMDPRFLKQKPKPKTMRSYQAPRYVHDYLVSKGINISEVCRSALERALATAKDRVEALEMGSYTYRVDADLMKRVEKTDINATEEIRKALLAMYSELKSENKRR